MATLVKYEFSQNKLSEHWDFFSARMFKLLLLLLLLLLLPLEQNTSLTR